MGFEGVGSSVVIALAAVLWLVYLTPTWFRRREYLSTERNALRLQQTMRILAETAETPHPTRVEITARDVAGQQKLLRQQADRDRAVLRAREAAMARAATRTLATLKPALAAEAVQHSTAARRLRVSRLITTVVMLAALVGLGAGALTSSVVALSVSGAVGIVALGLLQVMARVARGRAQAARSLSRERRVERPTSAPIEMDRTDAEPAAWTPVPLPKPLYLTKPAPQFIVSEDSLARDRARELARIAAAERAAIVAEQAEKVTPISRPLASPAAPAAPSRFARMGYVEDAPVHVTDLDDVLRRRRVLAG